MIPRPELHVADAASREQVRLDLRRIRAVQELRAVHVAAELGIKLGAFQRLELTTTWTAPTVQAWSRVLDHRFLMTVEGLDAPAGDADATAVVTFGARDEDGQHLARVVSTLVRVRKRSGLTMQDLADRLQCTARAASDWEKDYAAKPVRSVQRYTRALGGSVGLGLTPVVVAVPS